MDRHEVTCPYDDEPPCGCPAQAVSPKTDRPSCPAALEIYIHIPFCVKKCAYCDFLSAPADEAVREAYVQELIREIEDWKEGKAQAGHNLSPAEHPVPGHEKPYRLVSLFIGGGTPSILKGEQISRILRTCLSENRQYEISPDREITVECNPGTVTAEKLRAMRQAGVNRLSFGLQSADNLELKRLGRIHTWEQFQESYTLARAAGFLNINVDLMSGLPGQTVESWRRTLQAVLSLENPAPGPASDFSYSSCPCTGPEHVSAYSLIIEEGTPFYKLYHEEDDLRARGGRPRTLPSEEEERQMYYDTRDILTGAGFAQYEISNYSRPGRECIHNLGYWTGTEYVSFGLGATSHLGKTRYRNTADLKQYLRHHHEPEQVEHLTQKDDMEEMMFLGLRLMRGVSLEEFERRFHRTAEQVYGSQIRMLLREKLVQITYDEKRAEHFLRLTRRGLDVSNGVMAEFML